MNRRRFRDDSAADRRDSSLRDVAARADRRRSEQRCER